MSKDVEYMTPKKEADTEKLTKAGILAKTRFLNEWKSCQRVLDTYCHTPKYCFFLRVELS